jgi:hypothetical protein
LNTTFLQIASKDRRKTHSFGLYWFHDNVWYDIPHGFLEQ